ncbi:hypothetical protein MCOR26_008438 [Pyricularia oryzae]|nr:hypothetical protein MCOR26_008438 [Pyricularia oryzae]
MFPVLLGLDFLFSSPSSALASRMRTAQALSVFALLVGSGLATPVPASGAYYDGASSMLQPVSAAADFDDADDTAMPASAAFSAANTRSAIAAAADEDDANDIRMPVSAASSAANTRTAFAAAADEDDANDADDTAIPVSRAFSAASTRTAFAAAADEDDTEDTADSADSADTAMPVSAASVGTQGLRGNSRAAAAADDLAAAATNSSELPLAAAAGDIAIPQGFKKIVFQDNFAKQKAGALPDQAKWLIDLGTQYPGGAANWGTQEIQTYTNNPANLGIKNGALTITPVRNGNAWTSARIETKAGSDVQCPPGGKLRVEASLKLAASDPATQLGIWPAFWMLGQGFRTDRNSWPKVAEIDILEVSNGVGTVFHTAHCGVINGGPCKEKTGLGGSGQFPRGKFVKVAVTIDRSNKAGGFQQEKLEWSVDGKVTHTLTGAEVKDADAWENLARTPKMILLNVAIGGEFPDGKAKIKTPTAKTVGGEPSAMSVHFQA